MLQLVACARSFHAAVALGACEVLSSVYCLMYYVVPFDDTRKPLLQALETNKKHWCEPVRRESERLFEMLLDMA